jgi:hypothetical protein
VREDFKPPKRPPSRHSHLERLLGDYSKAHGIAPDRMRRWISCMALHRVSQRDLPVALAGAGLPTLPSMLRAAKPYASWLFSYHTLG